MKWKSVSNDDSLEICISQPNDAKDLHSQETLHQTKRFLRESMRKKPASEKPFCLVFFSIPL